MPNRLGGGGRVGFPCSNFFEEAAALLKRSDKIV
jgi:hypothetical protein